MSSIDSVDSRNSQATDAQSTRESYDAREKELVQRHRRELADLKAHHQAAMNQLKKEYENEINSLRDDSRQALSSKEKEHLRSIQEMQDASRKRFEKVKEEDDDKYQVTKSNLEGELARSEEKDNDDTKRLTKDFDAETNRRDEADSGTEVRNREDSQKALKDQAKRLKEKFDEERGYYQNYIREKNRQSTQSLTALNREREQEVGDLKSKGGRDRDSLDAKYQDSLRYERDRYNNSVSNLEKDFQHGMTENKEKLRDRADMLADQYHDNFENLKTSVNERVGKEVMATRRENMNLKTQNEVDKHQNIVKKEQEKRDLTDEFQNNFNELERRRLNAVKDAKEDKKRDVLYLHEEHDKEFRGIQNKYNEKIAENENRNANQYGSEIIQANRQRDLEKIQGDRQKKKLYEAFSDSTVAQSNFHDEQMDVTRKNYEKMMGDERVNAEKTRLDEASKAQAQLAKENVEHQEKLIDTVGNYEKQISTIRADYEKKLRRQADLFRDQTTKQVKGVEMDREASQQKLEARMAQMKESYERELDQLRKRQLQERQENALKKS